MLTSSFTNQQLLPYEQNSPKDNDGCRRSRFLVCCSMGHVPYGNSACVSIRVLCQFVYSQPQSSHHLLRKNLQCFELCRDDLVAVAVLAPHIRAETLQILPMARRRVHGTESLRIVGISPATTSYLFLCACPVPASMRNPLSAVFEAMSSVVITFSAAPPIVRVASSGLSWVATERSGIWIVNRSSDPEPPRLRLATGNAVESARLRIEWLERVVHPARDQSVFGWSSLDGTKVWMWF